MIGEVQKIMNQATKRIKDSCTRKRRYLGKKENSKRAMDVGGSKTVKEPHDPRIQDNLIISPEEKTDAKEPTNRL